MTMATARANPCSAPLSTLQYDRQIMRSEPRLECVEGDDLDRDRPLTSDSPSGPASRCVPCDVAGIWASAAPL